MNADDFDSMIADGGYVVLADEFCDSDLDGLTCEEILKAYEELKAYKEMWEELEKWAESCRNPEFERNSELIRLYDLVYQMKRSKKQYFPEGD